MTQPTGSLGSIRRAAKLSGKIGRLLGITHIPAVRRFYSAVQNLFLPGHDVLVQLEFGRMILPSPRRNILGRMLYLYESWEPDVAGAIRDNLREGMTALDVGANIGYFTLLMRHAVGQDGFVAAFEPQCAVRRYLQANLELHEARNAVICPVALFSRNGRAALLSGDNLNASLQLRSDGGANETVDLHAYDDYSAPGLDRGVGLVKIDVEGAEMDVLLGMRRMLLRDHPVLVVEVHPRKLPAFRRSGDALKDFLREIGYDISTVWNPGETETILAKPLLARSGEGRWSEAESGMQEWAR